MTSSCSGSGVGRRLGVGAKSAAYLASIESLEDSDEGKRPLALQRLKGSSTSQGQSASLNVVCKSNRFPQFIILAATN